MYFDLGKYHGELLLLYCKYNDLRDYCQDKDALYSHVMDSRTVTYCNGVGEQVESKEKGLLEKFSHHQSDAIKTAFETFELQIPVIFCSYLEDSIVSFITAYFLKYEHCISDFINPLDQSNIKGFVNINEILKCSSLEDLKQSLASRAAHNVASGKSKAKVFVRIEDFSKCKISSSTKKGIVSLYNKRNEIVHENKKFKIDADYIEEIYNQSVELLREFGKICDEKNVSYHDPSSLVTDSSFSYNIDILNY